MTLITQIYTDFFICGNPRNPCHQRSKNKKITKKLDFCFFLLYICSPNYKSQKTQLAYTNTFTFQ